MKACILFTKIPELGFAKTRLEGALGREGSFQFAQQLLARTIDVLEDTNVPLYVAYATNDKTEPSFSQATGCFPQCGKNIGARMAHAMETVFAKGYDDVILIGSDLPYLSTRELVDAFEALRTHAAVLGPSADGGYYLIGARRSHYDHAFFEIDAKWSTTDVLASTKKTMEQLGCTVATIGMQRDCDTEEHLRHLMKDAPEHPLSQWLTNHLDI